uniref:TLC domain-containing protein n=2 Tax=Ascaris TaxID=6251 RepID=A0A9J2PD65_ASCLU
LFRKFQRLILFVTGSTYFFDITTPSLQFRQPSEPLSNMQTTRRYRAVASKAFALIEPNSEQTMMNITEWSPAQWKKFGIGFFQVLLSFASFRLMQFAVRWYLFGRCTFRTFSYFGWRQDAVVNDREGATNIRSSQSLLVVPPNKKWRISNEAVSLIHSVVSGSWALYACLVYPQLLEDMVYYNNTFSHYLILLSTGYLLHDLIDLLINERSLRIMELLFHHVIVLIAFATTLATGYFLGVVVCGLLMELNSIFLHSRSLLNLYGVPKTSTAFRIIALLNIITFMLCRMVVSACLIYWQITTAWSMFWGYTLVTFVVIMSLAITNTVLCYRVLAADGLLGARRARRAPAVKVEESSVAVNASNTPNAQLVQPDNSVA